MAEQTPDRQDQDTTGDAADGNNSTKKNPRKKAVSKKAPNEKAVVKKSPVKKAAPKKAPTKKATAAKTAAVKPATKKAASRKKAVAPVATVTSTQDETKDSANIAPTAMPTATTTIATAEVERPAPDDSGATVSPAAPGTPSDVKPSPKPDPTPSSAQETHHSMNNSVRSNTSPSLMNIAIIVILIILVVFYVREVNKDETATGASNHEMVETVAQDDSQNAATQEASAPGNAGNEMGRITSPFLSDAPRSPAWQERMAPSAPMPYHGYYGRSPVSDGDSSQGKISSAAEAEANNTEMMPAQPRADGRNAPHYPAPSHGYYPMPGPAQGAYAYPPQPYAPYPSAPYPAQPYAPYPPAYGPGYGYGYYPAPQPWYPPAPYYPPYPPYPQR